MVRKFGAEKDHSSMLSDAILDPQRIEEAYALLAKPSPGFSETFFNNPDLLGLNAAIGDDHASNQISSLSDQIKNCKQPFLR